MLVCMSSCNCHRHCCRVQTSKTNSSSSFPTPSTTSNHMVHSSSSSMHHSTSLSSNISLSSNTTSTTAASSVLLIVACSLPTSPMTALGGYCHCSHCFGEKAAVLAGAGSRATASASTATAVSGWEWELCIDCVPACSPTHPRSPLVRFLCRFFQTMSCFFPHNSMLCLSTPPSAPWR